MKRRVVVGLGALCVTVALCQPHGAPEVSYSAVLVSRLAPSGLDTKHVIRESHVELGRSAGSRQALVEVVDTAQKVRWAFFYEICDGRLVYFIRTVAAGNPRKGRVRDARIDQLIRVLMSECAMQHVREFGEDAKRVTKLLHRDKDEDSDLLVDFDPGTGELIVLGGPFNCVEQVEENDTDGPC